MDFVIGLIAGLFFGGWIGLAVASLIAISRDKDIEAELNHDPDGSKAVAKDVINTLKRQEHNSRLDDETWKEDMDWDARQYEAEQYEERI